MSIYYQYKENTMRMSLHGKKLAYIPHFHPSLELVYVRRGNSTVLIDKQEYQLAADDLLLVFPHMIHGYRDDSDDLDRVLMFIPLEYCPAFKDQLCTTLPSCPVLHHVSQLPHLVSLLDHIYAVRSTQPPYMKEILTGHLSAFIGLLLPHLPLETISDVGWSTMHSILRYCALHYREPLSVTQIADTLHLHRSYVSNIFSQRMHIRFTEYLNTLRIEEAKHLLRTTNQSITTITEAVGFETIRTFNRAFRRCCDMTPSEYREQKQKNL